MERSAHAASRPRAPWASRVESLARSFVLLAAVLLGGCQRSDPPSNLHEDKVVVFAAASLREAFTSLSEEFKRAHAGVEVTFNFAGSQELRTQIDHGAAVDVFAAADTAQMGELVRGSRVAPAVVFARNEPVIVVARESATTIRSLDDLARASRLVVGAAEVPIGRYTLQILDRASTTRGADFRARVEANVVSRELNVRQVLAKVSLGEAQAGIVYRTDVRAPNDGVSIVSIPADANVVADYPIAIVTGAAHPTLARAWVDLVLSNEGQRAMKDAGFLAPSEGARP